MKKITIRRIFYFLGGLITGLLFSLLGGCVNLYTRAPMTDLRVDECYQSTEIAGVATIVLSFPQMMTLSGGSSGLELYNILTVPFLGLPCLVDTACEAVIDTVCYPADYYIAKKRHDMYYQKSSNEKLEDNRPKWYTRAIEKQSMSENNK